MFETVAIGGVDPLLNWNGGDVVWPLEDPVGIVVLPVLEMIIVVGCADQGRVDFYLLGWNFENVGFFIDILLLIFRSGRDLVVVLVLEVTQTLVVSLVQVRSDFGLALLLEYFSVIGSSSTRNRGFAGYIVHFEQIHQQIVILFHVVKPVGVVPAFKVALNCFEEFRVVVQQLEEEFLIFIFEIIQVVIRSHQSAVVAFDLF